MLLHKGISMIFEGLQLEFFNILIALAAIIIVYFAWKSTYVRDIPPTAVLIVENNRRRLLENIIRAQAVAGNLRRSRTVIQASDFLRNIETPAPSLQDVLEEVSDLTLSQESRISSASNIRNTQENDSGPQEIIENMDRTTDEPNFSHEVRRRNVGFYTMQNGDENISNVSTVRRENLNLQTTGDSTHAENCSNENNENENISKSELNKNQNDQTDGIINNEVNKTITEPIIQSTDDEFVIKLKYLNDDLRIVKGSPQEALGDFKKRNFTVELASEKLVRLVFNGHVLQPDTKTLQACGLFANCVVHCLVHKRTMQSNAGESNMQQDNRGNQLDNNNQTRSRSGNGISFRSGLTNGPLYVYFAVAVTSMAILFCWYCRFQYSSLFTLYSTIGLIFITALFLLIFPLVIVTEREINI